MSAALATLRPVDTWFSTVCSDCCVICKDCKALSAAELLRIELIGVLLSEMVSIREATFRIRTETTNRRHALRPLEGLIRRVAPAGALGAPSRPAGRQSDGPPNGGLIAPDETVRRGWSSATPAQAPAMTMPNEILIRVHV